MKSLRQRVRSGETVVGAWVMTPSAAYVDMATSLGIDFLVFDLEHGALSLNDVEHLARIARGTATAPLVRVPSHDPTIVSRVLDRGAAGIIVPRVEDEETAAMLAAAARFPPLGQRGLAIGAIAASEYGLNKDYRSQSDDVLVAMQIESRKALDHCVNIASAPGVDLAFIGPGDLAADLRLEKPENVGELSATVDEAAHRLVSAGLKIATVPHGGRSWQDLAARGFSLLVAYSDIGALREGLQATRRDVVAWRQRSEAGSGVTP